MAVEGEFSSQNGILKGTVTEDSSIKIYLNDDYYVNNINETAKEQMTSHIFNIGPVEWVAVNETDSLEENLAGEKMYQWKGNIGLINATDIIKASINPLCTSVGTSIGGDGTECNNNYLLSPNKLIYCTLNPSIMSNASPGNDLYVWRGYIDKDGNTVVAPVNRVGVYNDNPRPVVFLKSTIQLEGSGSESDAFRIVSY